MTHGLCNSGRNDIHSSPFPRFTVWHDCVLISSSPLPRVTVSASPSTSWDTRGPAVYGWSARYILSIKFGIQVSVHKALNRNFTILIRENIRIVVVAKLRFKRVPFSESSVPWQPESLLPLYPDPQCSVSRAVCSLDAAHLSTEVQLLYAHKTTRRQRAENFLSLRLVGK